MVRADGVVVDTTRLEHLDLTIHLVDGKLETDLFAKDVPNYVSRRSCHPPATFSSVAKAVARRLVLNCSLERFLSPRIEEYTRYLVASDYPREEVELAMAEARGLDREELLARPRRERRRGGRKQVLVTTWDPRAPNIKEGLRKFEEILYQNPDNLEGFPRGSIIQKREDPGRDDCSDSAAEGAEGEGGGRELGLRRPQVLQAARVRRPAAGACPHQPVGRPGGPAAPAPDMCNTLHHLLHPLSLWAHECRLCWVCLQYQAEVVSA